MTVQAPMTFPLAHGGRLVPTEGKTLPLTRAALRVKAAAGLGRAVLEQTFKNPHAEPLTVVYKMPLPADAAVSGFAFRIGDRRIVGEVHEKKAARQRFEEAVVDGRSAALLEEETSALFTQEIGNIPPGAEIVAEITLDQPLAFLAEGAWEFRFPLAAAPRYLGSQAASLTHVEIDVASGQLAARASLDMRIADELTPGRSPESPSHPLQCRPERGGFSVELGAGNQVALDRDVVVRWPVARVAPTVAIATARLDEKNDRGARSQFGLLTVVPPSPDAKVPSVKRDLTLLIDTSGSMQGEPLAQAKRVASSLVDSLADGDSLEMIEFGSAPVAFRSSVLPVTQNLKTEALQWIAALYASGGTEMLSGVQAALKDRRPEAQRQIVLLTDGLIGFERDIVSELLKNLPKSSRFHALGVGSAANRALLMPVARAGRGIEGVIGIGEDPERATARLLSRMQAPSVVDLSISGSALAGPAPSRLPDLFEAAPARIALELKAEGGELELRGRMADGTYVRRLVIEPLAAGAGSAAVSKLFARETVEDLETRIAGGESKSSLDREIEALGVAFQISTRLTSWVATSEERAVDPRDPSRKEVMPQALPFAMSAEGLGLAGSDGLARSMPPLAQGYAAMPLSRSRSMSMPAGMAPRMMAPRPMAPPASAPPAAGAARPSRAAPPGFGGPPAAPQSPAPYPFEREAERAAPEPLSEMRDRGQLGAEEEDAQSSGGAPRDMGGEDQAKGGFIDALSKKIRGVFTSSPSDALAAPPAEVAKSASKKKDTPLPRELSGRILLAKDRRIVIELVVPDDGIELDFEGASVVVEIDGQQVTARLEPAQSTREGAHSAGQVIRLAVSTDAEIDETKPVWAFVLLGTIRVRAGR